MAVQRLQSLFSRVDSFLIVHQRTWLTLLSIVETKYIFKLPLTSISEGMVTLKRNIADKVAFAVVQSNCTCSNTLN